VIFAVPLYDDNPVLHPPVVNYFLIGLCVGAFLWQLGQNQHQILFGLGMIPAVLFGSAHLALHLYLVPPWATVLTSMFLHGGWFHLTGNMLFLWIFGNNAEDTLGHTRYLRSCPGDFLGYLTQFHPAGGEHGSKELHIAHLLIDSKRVYAC